MGQQATEVVPSAQEVARGHLRVRPLVDLKDWKVRLAHTTGRACHCCGMSIGRNQWYVRVLRLDEMVEAYHYEHFWNEFGIGPSQ